MKGQIIQANNPLINAKIYINDVLCGVSRTGNGQES